MTSFTYYITDLFEGCDGKLKKVIDYDAETEKE